tara:strand:- start:145 stop:2574 length:2430 start_codon:yes stop_codon:yes gene_type:complete
MAERIVSPGVFTRETDLSFLPQAIGEIGAAIIGPTAKGPAFTPTQVTSFQQFEEMFGGVDDRFYTPYTVEQYLRSAGVVTIVRILGLAGYAADSVQLVAMDSTTSHSLAILAPSRGSSGTGDLSFTNVQGAGTWNSFTLQVSGSDVTAETYNLSFNTGSANYITEVISDDPQSQKSGNSNSSVYVYKVFSRASHAIFGDNTTATASAKNEANGLDFSTGATSIDALGNENSYTGNTDYSTARTPYIQSQLVGGTRYNLFRVYTRSHGSDINKQLKAVILNTKPATDVAGSDYGTFTIQVRVYDPLGTNDDTILEQFDALTFDPDSPNFFAKRIGDRFVEIDSNGKLTHYGDYPNLSMHIRVGDYTKVDSNISQYPKTVVPMGHAAVNNTILGTTTIPSASFRISQVNDQDIFESSLLYGFDFMSSKIRDDNEQYLAPIPLSAGTGNNVSMSLEDMTGNDNASILGSKYSGTAVPLSLSGSATAQLKFAIPFQFGFDGRNPATPYLVGTEIVNTNTQGFDLSSTTANGTLAYKRAINAISNPDEFDINLLATPGVIHRLHPAVTNHAISKTEARADALFIMDSAAYTDSVQTVVDTIKALDTNYVATYYPWVKIVNASTGRPVWVPPSVVLPGVISYTDRVAHEWFAPAGLNRGGLTTVLEAKTRLTHAERDELYEGRVNPIASFPGQGVVVFGQKTLQSKPSALDRINVRRLLITVRKFIASASRYLVFEQNTQALRNRFLNIVNPYLEQVQSNSGLSAFRVVMDDSNNTPDVVDRNQLVGQIFVQPTRTAEFIVLDFIVQPTGATFPE